MCWPSAPTSSDRFVLQVRERVPALIERIANGVAQAHGAQVTLDYVQGYRPVVNDPATAAALREAVRTAVPEVAMPVMNPLPNSEDFSAFTQHAPGAYALIGARSQAKGICHPHHHPLFDFDEDALMHGVRMFVAAPFVLNAMN